MFKYFFIQTEWQTITWYEAVDKSQIKIGPIQERIKIRGVTGVL
tara:strand:+ start:1382 stop:1513 length:132 start_codon:yes stop_codon:yes gene_type:complete